MATQISQTAITGSDVVGPRRVPMQALVLAAGLVVIAVLILGLAVPRVIAQGILLPIRPVLEKMHRGELLDVTQQAQATTALQSARRFQPYDSDIAIDLGLLALNELRRDGLSSPQGKSALLSGIENLQAGLRLSPADGFAWALLAQGRAVRDNELRDDARAALGMSYAMGPFDHGAMLVRSEITMSYWPALGDDLSKLARREILDLWRRSWDDQKKLIGLACGHNAVSALSESLRSDPSARKDFDQFYEPYLSPQGCKTAP